jgi:hypothetical protein
MSWISPLMAPVYKAPKPPDTSKPVTLFGIRYRSMSAASKALGCSVYKIWKMTK